MRLLTVIDGCNMHIGIPIREPQRLGRVSVGYSTVAIGAEKVMTMSVIEAPPLGGVGTCAPIHVDDQEIDCEKVGTIRQWTIKGLNSQTVDVSREAAKRSGMKINAWISQALETAAAEILPDSADGEDSDDAPMIDSHGQESAVQHLQRELARLRADNEDMRKTVKLMNDILLKLVSERI